MQREVERGSTFMLTCDLSYIASLLYAKVNFTHRLRDSGSQSLLRPVVGSREARSMPLITFFPNTDALLDAYCKVLELSLCHALGRCRREKKTGE